MKVCALWGVVIVDESESKLGDERPPNLEFTLAGRSLSVRVGAAVKVTVEVTGMANAGVRAKVGRCVRVEGGKW